MKNIRTDAQIVLMRQAGLLVWEAHRLAETLIQPGIETQEIDAAVDGFLLSRDAIPLFKGVPGPTPFPASTCISVNEQVVHGIPGARVLQEGDVVSVDVGVRFKGWCGDAARTYPVGQISPEAQRLLEVTEGALRIAIEQIRPQRKWSQIAAKMAKYVRDAGFSVVEELAGHSIGQEMWDGLHVPNYTDRNYERNGDFTLQPGMVLAVEPMVNTGTRRVRTLKDGWTIVTADGRPSAHFEHTILVTERGARVLTAAPDGTGWALPRVGEKAAEAQASTAGAK
jgi:methionyl aminopeptidase